MLEQRVASWALDFERRAMDMIQRCVDRIPAPKDGAPGCDGKDGFGFEDLSVVQLSDKQLQLIFLQGDRRKEFTVDMPILVDCGVYKQGRTYSKGDGVTWGGSFWIAQKDQVNQRPGFGDEWRLAVKKGRDAKETS